MTSAIDTLINFRQELLALLPKRSGAIMDLLDALTTHGHQCDSVVKLSSTKTFQRQYSSITDAIADGLPSVDWAAVRCLVYKYGKPSSNINRFIVDCTPNPRPFSKTLKDKSIVHLPNPAPGNKPIAVGHQYSVLSLLPNAILDQEKHWLVPMDAMRVKRSMKGNEVGMKQITQCIEDLALTNDLNISIGDSLYGSESCRSSVSADKNRIHIFRLSNKRNIFSQPDTAPSTRGRKKEFGACMKLGDPSTHPPCTKERTVERISKKGKKLKLVIKSWDDRLLRGSRTYRASQHPLNVIQVITYDEAGNEIFKRPMWIAVLGERRHELDSLDVYENYRARYDTEHLFRFGKQKLLLDKYQTPKTEHEELWWSLCLLAYTQLYLARNVAPILPQKWERYLPEFNCTNQHIVASASMTQRGFATVLERVGSPVAEPVARGNPRGRMEGDSQEKREPSPTVFKGSASLKKTTNPILAQSDSEMKISGPKKIDAWLKQIQKQLDSFNISAQDLAKRLLDSS